MAVLDSHEQEQLEALKAWWKDNANWVLGALLAVVLAVGGWRGWEYYKNQQAVGAATLYQQLVEQVNTGDAKRVNDAAAVMDKFSSTGYAPRAALLAAQVNEHSKDMAKAKTQLQWVIDHAAEDGLKTVARLRMAAVLLDEKDFAGAMQQLDAPHPASFDGLFADLRGDVLGAQGKAEEARSAYKLAYEKTDAKSQYRSLIQLKLDGLGGTK